ncbi:MAG: hypothetical protein A4E65_01529 [Syntrophorhabdus sp. PtaU1.Bin153]|nr:MAG: hypothetical protein A4E65_01529 [Syntrophorhabdus sp. PtaU1.Bin153]
MKCIDLGSPFKGHDPGGRRRIFRDEYAPEYTFVLYDIAVFLGKLPLLPVEDAGDIWPCVHPYLLCQVCPFEPVAHVDVDVDDAHTLLYSMSGVMARDKMALSLLLFPLDVGRTLFPSMLRCAPLPVCDSELARSANSRFALRQRRSSSCRILTGRNVLPPRAGTQRCSKSLLGKNSSATMTLASMVSSTITWFHKGFNNCRTKRGNSR